MVKRQCPKCKAIFNQKCHYDYHINRKYDCNPNKTEVNDLNDDIMGFQNMPNNAVFVPNYAENGTNNIYKDKIEIKQSNMNINKEIEIKCCYCDNIFSSKSTLTRHQKVNCKIKKENDNEKENIFKLLLEKDKQYKEELKLHKEEVSELKKQNQLLMDKIDKLINLKDNSKLSKTNGNGNKNSNNNNTINTNSNNTIKNETNNTQNNIVMVNFGKEDLSIIDEKQFIDRVIKKPMLSGVKIPDEVLKIIHFNPQYPQLSNIYISDINREKCMVYEDGEWKLSSVDNIPQIMDKVCIFSADQINTLRIKHPNNKPLQDRLGIIEKYNNLIDGDYLEDLRDGNVDGTNQNQISRCEDFQAHTYNTLKKTLYNEGKKLKKTLNKK